MSIRATVRYQFEDHVFIVTGAAQGIGAACAELLTASGAAVALWDVNRDRGQALSDSINQKALGRSAFFSCNVANKAEVDSALLATLKAFDRIDGLINNAGIFRAADFLDITEADWNAVLDVNLKGAFLVGQAVARAMSKSGGGAIVNMSSVNAVMAIPSIASYNASKGGINQLTRVMALALADHGVRVNAVGPGTIATELAKNAVLGSEEAQQRIMSRTPLKRLGNPDEVAAVCAFLLSNASSYMTGQIVYVDGGRMALNYTVSA